MMGLYLSGSRRVRPVIVGCSTAPPAQASAINDTDGCSLADGPGQLPEKLGRECVEPGLAGIGELIASEAI
jgi:hypothetical protein